MLTMGLRGSCSSRRGAFPIPRRMRSPPARPTVLDARARRRDARRSAGRLRADDRAFGAPARVRGPRAAGARCRARGDRRTPADGDVALVFGTEMSGLSNDELAPLRGRGDDPRESRLCVAQPRGGRAGRGVRAVRRGAGATSGARRGLRRRRTTRSRLSTRTPANAHRAALPRSAHAAAAAAAAAAPVRARGTRARGSEHPARHPRARRREAR